MMNRPLVPFVVSWSGENAYEVRPCRWAGGKLAVWQRHAPGVGRPLFEDLHMVRSRRAVAQWLCAICGEPTAHHDRAWFGLGRADLKRDDGSTWAWSTFNAPNHWRCAEAAASLCPHLAQRGVKPMAFPTPDAIVATNLTQDGPSRGLTLRSGQSVVGPLAFVFSAKPKGAL